MDRVAVKKYPGVYYRVARRGIYNNRPDRVYGYSYEYEGKKRWVTVGRASRGVTAALANALRRNVINKIDLGEPITTSSKRKKVTCQAVLTAWLTWAEGEGRDVSREKSAFEKHLIPTLGQISLDNLTLQLLEKHKAALLAKMAPASVKQLLAFLKAAINLAIKRKAWPGPNPLAHLSGFTMPKVDNKAERFLSPAEANLLLAELARRSPVWRDMAYVSLLTGMRLTEILRLRGRDVNEATATAMVVAKGRRREPVALSKEALAVLVRNVRGPEEPVFRNKAGHPFPKAAPAFIKAVKACGFYQGPDRRYRVIFHTLRHTYASWLAQAGVSVYDLKLLLRHSDINMTMRYAHLIPDQQREHVAVIPRMLGSQR